MRFLLPPALLAGLAAGGAAWSAEETGAAGAALAERIAALEQSAQGVNTGDHAWLLISVALVLLMTSPGLALFYGGLVRRKNVLSTMMHSFFLAGLVSLLWALYGYSLAFGSLEGPAGLFFGSPTQYFLLRGVDGAPNSAYAATVPHQTFMLFQLMFAIITPALISGAFAERIKFSALVIFTLLWSTLVYFPLAHMVWGQGGLFNWALGGRLPALDFAGGTVVHISSGFSALIFALVLGRRKGYPQAPMPPHNLVLCLVGAGLLWFGWFGFNAGSALGAGNLNGGNVNLAASAFAATHFAAAMAALAWSGAEWWLRGKPSALGFASGLVAGLVGVTPAAGFVSVPSAMLIGLLTGLVCFFAVTKVKAWLGYDDALDAFGIHGVGGLTGALLTGLLASTAVNPLLTDTFKVAGAAYRLEGGARQFLNQLQAAGLAILLAGAATYLILRVVDATVGLRVSAEEELQGLDLSQHGEEGYAEQS